MDDEVIKILDLESNIPMDRDTKLVDLGIDSLGWLAVVFDIEKNLKKRITEEDMEGLVTVGDLIDRVKV